MPTQVSIRANGQAFDYLRSKTYLRSGGTAHLVDEGDNIKQGGVATPLIRFSNLPFTVALSGTNMVFKYGISDRLLKASPKVGCIGSSTMAGYNLSSPNRLEDRLLSWLTANTTGTPTLVNLAVGGITLADLLPTAPNAYNIASICAQNPTFVFCLEPTNWANSYDTATQIAHMITIRNYAWDRGIFVIFGSSFPRTPYSGTQDTRLVELNTQLKVHPILKYHSVDFLEALLKASTTADLRTDYDQGDGIHLNASGNIFIANVITWFWDNILRPVNAFDQYVIEKSADGSTGWAAFQTVTDMTSHSLTLPAQTGYYRMRGRIKTQPTTFTSYSSSFQITAPAQRVLFDLGGNGTDQGGGGGAGGVRTPSNTPNTATPGQDGLSPNKWWNNLCLGSTGAATLFSNPVDIDNNTITGFSCAVDKKFGGTYLAGDKSINYAGAGAGVGDYPLTATQDSFYMHNTTGTLTLTFTIPAGKTMSLKLWGARGGVADDRTIQYRVGTSGTFLDGYNASSNTTFTNAISLTGLTGTAVVQLRTKGTTNDSWSYVGVIDITLT